VEARTRCEVVVAPTTEGDAVFLIESRRHYPAAVKVTALKLRDPELDPASLTNATIPVPYEKTEPFVAGRDFDTEVHRPPTSLWNSPGSMILSAYSSP